MNTVYIVLEESGVGQLRGIVCVYDNELAAKEHVRKAKLLMPKAINNLDIIKHNVLSNLIGEEHQLFDKTGVINA